jgi:D-alanyl-D-alanine carboxypeptidase
MWYFFISLLAVGLFNPGVVPSELDKSNPPENIYSGPQRDFSTQSVGVEITASSTLVTDVLSGRELYAKEPDLVVPIASISKLMTALVFLETNPDWNKVVKLLPVDEVYRAKYVYRGEEFTVQQIFWTMLIGSDNNAAMALVRSTGLSVDQFVERMNQKAKDLGFSKTSFSDPTGLSPQNVSSARELTRLATLAWNEPEIIKPSTWADFILNDIKQNIKRKVINTNKLLGSFLDIEAGKTGFIDEAGYDLVARISENSGHKILVVTLGSATDDDRFQDTKVLAWWVYANYLWP